MQMYIFCSIIYCVCGTAYYELVDVPVKIHANIELKAYQYESEH